MGGEQPFDNHSTRMRSPREWRGIVVDDNNVAGFNRKRGRPGGSQIRNAAKKGTTTYTGIILSLEHKQVSGLRARDAGLNHDEECMNLEMDQKLQTNNISIPEKKRTHRRKRGRPRKVSIRTLNAAKSDQNENVAEDSIMSEVDSLIAFDTILVTSIEGNTPAKDSLSRCSDCKKLTGYSSIQKNVSADIFNTISARMSGCNGEGSNSQHEIQISKKANGRTYSAKENPQTQDANMVKMAESVCITKETKMGSKHWCNMIDDQPLSKWFEEMQSVGSSMVAKLHNKSMKVKERINETPDSDNNEGAVITSDEVDTQSPAVGTESLSASREPELPFVKNTSIWAVVESTEVFLKMPQKPHFGPLLRLKESSREGFAIACMVNFCSVVESISRLQFDDPKEKIDDILDSLNDLETHGFSVQVLRDRISDLLSIKEHRDQLRAEVDEMNQQVTLCNLEKSEQDKEISEITAQIKKLEEKRAKAESIKEIKDGEIAVLESRRQDIEETMRKYRSCYDELAAALCGSC